jgi:hypothetical protein
MDSHDELRFVVKVLTGKHPEIMTALAEMLQKEKEVNLGKR